MAAGLETRCGVPSPSLLFLPPQTRRDGGRADSEGGKACSPETTWKKSERSRTWSVLFHQSPPPPPPPPVTRFHDRPPSTMDSAFVSTGTDIRAAHHLFFAVLYKQSRGDTAGVVIVEAWMRHKRTLGFPLLSGPAVFGITKP